jgi:hypothetical protein
MSHVKVTYLRHAPPFMPGDVSTLPADKASALKASGIVKIEGSAETPVIASGAAEFDPAKSPIEEVRAFIVGRGEKIADNAPDAALRRQASAILAKKPA